MTETYNQKFKEVIKNKTMLIYTYNGDKESGGIYTRNHLNKHFIYIDFKVFNMLEDDEKDAAMLHEIGHIMHKNYIKILTIIMIVFSLIFAISSLIYFSINSARLFSIHGLIFNIIIFILMIISIINVKYFKKILYSAINKGEKKADYFALNYIKPESLKTTLAKLYSYSEYNQPEYYLFLEKYFNIRSSNINNVTHIIIKRYK